MIRTPSDPGIPYVHEIRSVAPSDTGMMMVAVMMMLMKIKILMVKMIKMIEMIMMKMMKMIGMLMKMEMVVMKMILMIFWSFPFLQECTPVYDAYDDDYGGDD